LTLSNEEIAALIDQYDKDSKALKHDLLSLCWFMRGGITYEEATMMCYEDRKIISEIVKSNMETTKESGLPFF